MARARTFRCRGGDRMTRQTRLLFALAAVLLLVTHAERLVPQLLATTAQIPAPLIPQPGTFDTSFNGTGRVITSLSGTTEYVADVALQLDGKIIVAAFKDGGPTRDFVVVRYLPDGSLDTTFNGTGLVTTDFELTGDTVASVLLQPDGKIIVAGFCWSPGYFLLSRYHPNGALDTSFGGGDGKVTAPTPTPYPYLNDAALQSDGKIVVAGIVRTDPYFGIITTILARFLPDGGLDPTFGAGGLLHPAVNSFNAGLTSVLVQPDGKIVAASEERQDRGRRWL